MPFATQSIQLDGCDQLLQLHEDVVPSPLVVRMTFDYASIAVVTRITVLSPCAWFFLMPVFITWVWRFFHMVCTCQHKQLWVPNFVVSIGHRGFLTWCIVVPLVVSSGVQSLKHRYSGSIISGALC